MSDAPVLRTDQVSDVAKLQFDFYKHLTTLASAGAAFQIAVLEKFNIPFSSWAAVALFGFGASALGSFVEMAFQSRLIGSKRACDIEGSFIGLLACVAFSVGCVGLVISLRR